MHSRTALTVSPNARHVACKRPKSDFLPINTVQIRSSAIIQGKTSKLWHIICDRPLQQPKAIVQEEDIDGEELRDTSYSEHRIDRDTLGAAGTHIQTGPVKLKAKIGDDSEVLVREIETEDTFGVIFPNGPSPCFREFLSVDAR